MKHFLLPPTVKKKYYTNYQWRKLGFKPKILNIILIHLRQIIKIKKVKIEIKKYLMTNEKKYDLMVTVVKAIENTHLIFSVCFS